MQKERGGKSSDLLEQFKPLNEADLAIHVKKIEEVKTWLTTARRHDPTHQILFVTGPPGSGKSTCVHTIAAQLKYEVVEWATPVDVDVFFDDKYDFDSREEKQSRRPQKALFDDFLYKSSRYCSLFQAPSDSGKLLVVNDFPNSMLRKPEEFHDSLEKYCNTSTLPIVFIASDASSKALDIAYNLFPAAVAEAYRVHQIRFNPVSVSLLKKAIKRIACIVRSDKELTKIYQAAVTKPVEENVIASAQGDLRNCCLSFLFASMKGISNRHTNTGQQARFLNNRTTRSSTSGPEEDDGGIGLSENVSMMHGLGRIFHPKLVAKGTNEARFVHSPESIVDCFISQQGSMLSLLHSNYVSRCSDVQNLAVASENLTVVDVIMNEYRSDQLSLIGLNIAVRGTMVSNQQSTTHGWQQIKKKHNLRRRHSDAAYADELKERGVITQHIRLKHFATEYRGLVKIIQTDAKQTNKS